MVIDLSDIFNNLIMNTLHKNSDNQTIWCHKRFTIQLYIILDNNNSESKIKYGNF